MVLWGSSIDPLKATKYVEPVVTDILPPPPTPHRPVVDDPASTSSTQYAKPTVHLPPSHLPPTQGNKPDSGADKQPPPPGTEDGDSSMMTSQKWYFMSIGAFLGLMAAFGLYLWRRRAARTRLNEYTSLATADDIHMDAVVDSPAKYGPRIGMSTPGLRRLSLDNLDEHPLIGSSGTRKEWFHSPFLDDDELSPPTFRPGPEDRPPHPLAEASYSVNRSVERVDENSPWFVVK